MVALKVVGVFIITLLGLFSGDASAWAYEAPPSHVWDACRPPCRALPAPCGKPIRPRGACDRAVAPDTSRLQAPGNCPANGRSCGPSLPKWWTRDAFLRFILIALAVLAIGALLFFLFRMPLSRLRFASTGSGSGTSSAPVSPPSSSPQPVDIRPFRPRAGDNVLLILRIVGALLSIALIFLTLCQQIGYCPTNNDVPQRMRERLIEILRWLAQ
jgi:hypothetical protein